jgi:iron complex outermembrane receptor protein
MEGSKQNALSVVLQGLIGLTLASFAHVAFAEELESIVVTAEKRPASIQETPISIAVLSAQDIAVGHINNLEEMKVSVPGLLVQNWTTQASLLQVYIRGQGLFQNVASLDPAVAINLDGVYMARPVGQTFEFIDLDHVEILRGPQGTLYGRNTSGGAINIISRRPNLEELTGSLIGEAGNYDHLRTGGYVSFPVINNELAVSLAAVQDSTDGWVKGTSVGNTGSSVGGFRDSFGGLDRRTAKFAARWRPVESLTFDYMYDLTRDTSEPMFNQNLGTGAQGPFGAVAPGAAPAFSARTNTGSESVTVPDSDITNYGHNLTFNWEFAPNTTLRSISAYRNVNSTSYNMSDGGLTPTAPFGSPAYYDNTAGTFFPNLPHTIIPLPSGVMDRTGSSGIPIDLQHQFSQEFNLIGSAGKSISYVAGLYYFTEKGSQFEGGLLGPNNLGQQVAEPYTGPGGGTLILPIHTERYNTYENRSRAVFGQVTYTPPFWAERTHLTIGGRYTIDDRGLLCSPCGVIFPVNLGVPSNQTFSAEGNRTFDHFDPSVTLNAEVSEHLNVYVKYAQGFRSGGLDVNAASLNSLTITDPVTHITFNTVGFTDGFKPEVVTNYEIGVKGAFFDGLLSSNIAVFYDPTKDALIPIAVPGANAATNLLNGKFLAQGVEIESTIRATQSLAFGINYSYLDANYQSILNAVGQNITSKYSPANAPRNQFAVSGDYDIHAPLGVITIHSAYNWVGLTSSRTTVSQNPYNQIPSFGLLTAQITLSEVAKTPGFEYAIWGKNLTDKQYLLGSIPGSQLGLAGLGDWTSARVATFGQPRTYGVQVRYKF